MMFTPEFNSHFRINSTAKQGNVYTLEGEIVGGSGFEYGWDAVDHPRRGGRSLQLG
jgi:hypothetical protein